MDRKRSVAATSGVSAVLIASSSAFAFVDGLFGAQAAHAGSDVAEVQAGTPQAGLVTPVATAVTAAGGGLRGITLVTASRGLFGTAPPAPIGAPPTTLRASAPTSPAPSSKVRRTPTVPTTTGRHAPSPTLAPTDAPTTVPTTVPLPVIVLPTVPTTTPVVAPVTTTTVAHSGPSVTTPGTGSDDPTTSSVPGGRHHGD